MIQLPVEVAVFAEHSDTTKKMATGWNTRVFNRTEVQIGDAIRLQPDTGHVHLSAGLYHITASSMVTWNDPGPLTPGDGRMSIELRPFGGYCRLRHAAGVDVDNEDAIAIGTMTNSNLMPSLIDTYLSVERQATVILEHQIGESVENMFLQLYVVKSTWHVFARMTIQRVCDARGM